jgi:protein involved in polysaccharide export with SLBB domain
VRGRAAIAPLLWALLGSPCEVASAAQAVPPEARAADSPTVPPAESARPEPYVLQAGDEIEIKAFDAPDLQAVTRIRPDGQVSLLLLDEVTAAGLTVAQLNAALRSAYSKYYRNPQITVSVRTFANLNVYVGGEVGQPGLLSLTGQLTAVQAVLRAGGFRDSAQTTSVILLRRGADGTALVTRLNLKDALNKGQPDVMLKPFDVVYVPKKFIARADLFVREYIRDLLPISTNMNFSYIGTRGSGFIP